MHLLKIRHRGLATSSGHNFNIAAEIPSNPWAFFVSNFLMIDTILFTEKLTSDIELLVSGAKVGRVDSMLKGWH